MSTAIAYTELGGPEVLTTIDIEVPAPGPGEVSLRVEAVGVNPLDLKLRAGLRPSPPITSPDASARMPRASSPPSATASRATSPATP